MSQFDDVEIYVRKLNLKTKLVILSGGLKHPDPKAYMDEVVSAYVAGESYNAFIEEHPDNPYVRVIILGGLNALRFKKAVK